MTGYRSTGPHILRFWLLLSIVVSASALSQSHDWEKQGRFREPGQALPRGVRALTVHPAPENPVYDVLDYQLDLSAAMVDETFGGTNTISAVLKTTTDTLVFNQHQLTITAVQVDGVTCQAVANDADETLVIRLGEAKVSGDTLHIVITYLRDPALARSTDRLGYFFFRDTLGIPANLGYTMSEPSDARCWMPCYDQPWEKATAGINITVPKGYVAASNGKLLDVTDNGDGLVTWKWREGHQIATYLMCATISKWSVSSAPFVRAPGDTIPIQYYTWQADSSAAAVFLPTVVQMVTALSGKYGPYPWDKYGMTSVVPFNYGGMEHQTITTMHHAYQTSQSVVVHELAHQWWGDLVTCGTWPDIWLNESFATYSEALWFESSGGMSALLQYMQSDALFFGSWYGRIYDPETQGFGLFPSSVYEKGAWVLHMLRGVLGDSLFFKSYARWRALYGERSATTQDFQAVVEGVAGGPMGWFFNEWIYGSGWPVYSSAFRWGNDTLHVTIAQQQSGAWPAYTMPLPVRVYLPGDDTTLVLQDSLRLQGFAVPFPVRPDSVVLDPDGWVLKQRGPTLTVGDGSPAPSSFVLFQNYPNPFNPATTIRYRIPSAGRVTLDIVDLLGRIVRTLVDGSEAGGEHLVQFDAKGLASGMYVYRLRSASDDGISRTATGRMLLIR